MDFLLTGRTLCNSDWRAVSAISGERGGKQMPADILKLLSREELIVLLTASLLESPSLRHDPTGQ
jgi:hypothetical protein